MATNNQENNRTANFLARLAAPQIEPPWTNGDLLALLGALGMAMILISGTVPFVFFGGNLSGFSLLSGFTLGLLIVGAFIYVRFYRRGDDWQGALRLVQPQISLILLLLMGVGAAMTIDVIAALASGTFRPVSALSIYEQQAGLVQSGFMDWVLVALFLVVVQPIVEGLAFFGILLPRFRYGISPWGGFFVTLLLFVLLHAAIYGSLLPRDAIFWYGIFYPAATGAVLAAVRVRTSSTLATITVYVGMGLTAFLIALVV